MHKLLIGIDWINDLRLFRRYLKIKYACISTIKKDFKKNLGYNLNLDNPKTFNEKLQWLKIFYKNPLTTQCADKYAVRNYVEKKIGPKYLNELFGVYNSIKEIDLGKLPDQFVLKPNHSSGRVIICKDKNKMDWDKEFKKMKKWLKENLYYFTGEWCYKNIKPKIICEKLLDENIIDYKFMCFNGKPKCSFVCLDRAEGMKINFYDMDWNRLPFIRKYPNADYDIPKPLNYEKMVEVSEILSEDFPFVRVDFYEVNNRLYFGELTFFPGNGMEYFVPFYYDELLGSWLDLHAVR
jgi:hypothetical protein